MGLWELNLLPVSPLDILHNFSDSVTVSDIKIIIWKNFNIGEIWTNFPFPVTFHEIIEVFQ